MTVAELLEKPENWCQGCNARTKDGTKTGIGSDDAYSYCLFGAIMKCYWDEPPRDDLLNKILELTGAPTIPIWNDDWKRTHTDVLELVKKAGI